MGIIFCQATYLTLPVKMSDYKLEVYTQPWWLGGRAYDQIQVGCHSCLGGFESRLGMLYQSFQ